MVYWSSISIMEKKMETTMVHWESMGIDGDFQKNRTTLLGGHHDKD